MKERKRISVSGGRCAKGFEAVCRILFLHALATVLCLLADTSVAAQNLARLDILGGPGGNNFEHLCGPGRMLE